jgi:hypothetical protein
MSFANSNSPLELSRLAAANIFHSHCIGDGCRLILDLISITLGTALLISFLLSQPRLPQCLYFAQSFYFIGFTVLF